MDNPYAAGKLTPELVAEERRRPKLWRGVLLAYGVHHCLAVAGIFIGLFAKPSEWERFFPPDNPSEALFVFVSPPVMDAYLVVEPVFAIRALETSTLMWWWWLRAFAVLTIPFAAIAYGARRQSWLLCYLGIVSIAAFASMVLSSAILRI